MPGWFFITANDAEIISKRFAQIMLTFSLSLTPCTEQCQRTCPDVSKCHVIASVRLQAQNLHARPGSVSWHQWQMCYPCIP